MISKAHNPLIHKLLSLNILKEPVTTGREKNDTKCNRDIPDSKAFFLAKILASGFFAGYVPLAQGTISSLWGPALYLLLPDSWFVNYAVEISWALPGICILLYFIGVWSAGVCEVFWGHDPGRVVIDEVVGMFVTLVFVPLTLKTVWTGFILFRVFDILKPSPVRLSEKLPGGWGVMSDDVIAGVYANISLRIMEHLFRMF